MGSLLSEELRPVAQLFRSHHEKHLEQSKAALSSIGASVSDEPLEAVTGKIPALEGDAEALTYALRLETMAVQSYVGMVALLNNPDLRAHAAQTLGGEVAHVVALRAAVGDISIIEAADFAFTTDLNPYLGDDPYEE